MLTCKSLLKFGYGGERLIERSSSWFPPKFLSGKLESDVQYDRVKIMIRGLGENNSSTYSQTLNRSAAYDA